MVLTTNDHLQTLVNFLKFFHVLFEKSIKMLPVCSSIKKISSDIFSLKASSMSYKTNFINVRRMVLWKHFVQLVLTKTQQNPYDNVAFSLQEANILEVRLWQSYTTTKTARRMFPMPYFQNGGHWRASRLNLLSIICRLKLHFARFYRSILTPKEIIYVWETLKIVCLTFK